MLLNYSLARPSRLLHMWSDYVRKIPWMKSHKDLTQVVKRINKNGESYGDMDKEITASTTRIDWAWMLEERMIANMTSRLIFWTAE